MHVADPDIVAGMSQRQLSSERYCFLLSLEGMLLGEGSWGDAGSCNGWIGSVGWRLGWVEGGGQWVWVGRGVVSLDGVR